MQNYSFHDVSSVKLVFGPRRAKDAIYFQFTDGPQCIMAFNDRSRGETYFNFPKNDGIREFNFNGVHVVVQRVNLTGDQQGQSVYIVSVNTPVFTSIFEKRSGDLVVKNYIG